jgi:hypothetical protein
MTIRPSQPGEVLGPGESIKSQQHERIEHLTFEVAKAEAGIAALEEKTVKGYRGGRRGGAYTVSYAEAQVTSLQKKIDHQVADGAKNHNRVSAGMKSLVLLPLLTDFIIVFLFLASIFNVSLGAPLDTPAETVTALVMSVIVTVGLAVTLRWIGSRRREDKNGDGQYRTGSRQLMPRLEIGLVTLLLVLVATVMLVRITSDAANAGIALGAGWVVAIFLAVITAALNWIIYYMEFADGSPETHELDHWGKVLAPIRAERAELKRKRNQAQEELRVIEGASEGSAKPSTVANPLAEVNVNGDMGFEPGHVDRRRSTPSDPAAHPHPKPSPPPP